MKANRVLLSSGISYFFSVVFFLFLSVACYGQATISDQTTILVNQIEQELNSKQYDDCIATCKELEYVLISANQSETQMYVDCLFIQVKALYHSQRVSEATSLAERALKIQERITGTNTSIYAGCLNRLGICYLNNNAGKAVECQKKAFEIYEKLYGINSEKCYQELYWYIKSLQRASIYNEAYELCKKRLIVAEELYTQKSEAVLECLLNSALIAQKLSRTANEQLFVQLALDLVNDVSFSNKGGYVNFLYKLARVLQDYNHFGAIMILEECVSFLDNYIYRDENMYINCVSMLGKLYYFEGNFNKASMCFEKERNLCKQAYGEKSYKYILALVNLAQCMSSNEAYEIYHKAFTLLNDVSSIDDDIYNNAKTLIMIGRYTSSYAQSFKKSGYKKRALQINKEALKEINQAINALEYSFGYNHDLMYDARQVLSHIYSNMSQHKKSLLIAKENLECAEQKFSKESYSYARALSEMAVVCSQAKMYKEANMYNEESLAIYTKAGEYSTDECLNIIRREISDRLSFNSKDSTIVYLYEDYLARLKDNVIGRFVWMNSEERSNFSKEFIENSVINILLKEDNLRKNDPRMNKLCFNALQILKGILINTDVYFRKAIEKSGNLIKKDYQKIMTKQIELEKNIKKNNRNDAKLDTQRKEIQKLERFLAQEVSNIDYFSNEIRINFQDVQTHLKYKEVVVDFYKHFGTYFAFVVSYDSNKVDVFEVCSDRDIKKLNKNKCYGTDSVYNIIWKPLESVIDSASTVYFIPDGELYSLALESADLTQKRIYHRLSSSRQICLERDSFLGKDAVVYGGIDYDVDSCGQKMNGTPQKCTLRSLRETLDFLPGSQKEATEISGILNQNGFKVNLLTGQSATEESFKKLSDTSVNVLHVSTHGYCWSQQKYAAMVTNNPLLNQGDFYQVDEDLAMIRTGLMFAGANNAFINKVGDTGLDDGILTAKEICNLNLQNVNLVVLSACKSGLGEVSRDGVYGLQRAFKKAGVKSIVMSLWAIDDSVTQDFMIHFYKGLASGLSKAKALLQAKMLIREKYPHSNDWAAFVLLD